jgi:hypothetical protein
VLDFADEMSEAANGVVKVYETSAKTGRNVETLFFDIAKVTNLGIFDSAFKYFRLFFYPINLGRFIIQ